MTPDHQASHGPPGGDPMTPRAAFWRALSIWVLTLATAATALIYNHVHPLPPSLSGGQERGERRGRGGFIGGFATVGALLGWKRPANPIGWLLSATGLSYAARRPGLLLLQFPADPRLGQLAGLAVFPRRRVRGFRPAALPDRFAALAPLAAGGMGRRRRHRGVGSR